MTGEDLGYRPGVLEQTKFDYSPLGKVLNKGLDDKDDKKGLLKRLKNTEKNPAVNNNDKNKKTNDESEPSSVKSKSSKKTSEMMELERSVCSPDIANMEGIHILGSKDETQTSYLKDDLEMFFFVVIQIFLIQI